MAEKNIRRYENRHLADPAWDAVSITPGASALADPIRALYVGTGGDVTVTTPAGTSVQFPNLQGGVIYPIRATHVTAATASDLVGLI